MSRERDLYELIGRIEAMPTQKDCMRSREKIMNNITQLKVMIATFTGGIILFAFLFPFIWEKFFFKEITPEEIKKLVAEVIASNYTQND